MYLPLDVTQIHENLWIGAHPSISGHRCADHPSGGSGQAVRAAGFDTLVLCAKEWQIPGHLYSGVEVLHAPFDDNMNGPTAGELETAVSAADRVSRRLEAGKKCLVTCYAGRNRSGLVCALALSATTGMSPAQAGEIVRAKRLGALTNLSFRGLLGRIKVERNGAGVKPCELCAAEVLTRRYHEDGICWIADCKSCSAAGRPVPMAVYRQHGVVPPEPHLRHMLEILALCGKPRRGGYKFEAKHRSIPSHFHVHLVPNMAGAQAAPTIR